MRVTHTSPSTSTLTVTLLCLVTISVFPATALYNNFPAGRLTYRAGRQAVAEEGYAKREGRKRRDRTCADCDKGNGFEQRFYRPPAEYLRQWFSTRDDPISIQLKKEGSNGGSSSMGFSKRRDRRAAAGVGRWRVFRPATPDIAAMPVARKKRMSASNAPANELSQLSDSELKGYVQADGIGRQLKYWEKPRILRAPKKPQSSTANSAKSANKAASAALQPMKVQKVDVAGSLGVEETSAGANGDIISNLSVKSDPEIMTPPKGMTLRQWLVQFNEESEKRQNTVARLNFDYETNMTNANLQSVQRAQTEQATWAVNKTVDALRWQLFQKNQSPEEKRQLMLITRGAVFMDADRTEELQKIQSKLESIYAEGKLCTDTGCMSLEPELKNLIASDRTDTELLLWAWKGWRDVTGSNDNGKYMRELYFRMVELQNLGAKSSGYKEMGETWRALYEVENLPAVADELFNEIKPLYELLHAYVRHKLMEFYAKLNQQKRKNSPQGAVNGLDEIVNDVGITENGPIPAHILGDMWAQNWGSLIDILEPYKDVGAVDVTPVLRKKNITVLDMVRMAEDFFVSLGLSKLSDKFWQNSMFERPKDGRPVQCHASASDMFDGKDYRIKMCASVGMESFYTLHHEIGHIHYDMLYFQQPDVFRGGANPAFHEALGDTVALSVMTPTHLEKLNLLPPIKNKNTNLEIKRNINFLFKQGLQKLVLPPFALSLEKWRWGVFAGNISKEKANNHYWKLVVEMQGVKPPVPRRFDDFDPGAKYHIAANVPYIRYFISAVVQFQFHEALCDAAQYKGELMNCDIYNSKEAGNRLKKMLELGTSKPWPDAMQALTGQRKISTSGLKRYFQPLEKWLREFVNKKGLKIGWEYEEVRWQDYFDFVPKSAADKKENANTEL